uniref:DUF8039 domain-containing protein n=1 Tax=Oryza sativa subsp. japonica TaxID=39947 RepID=Q6UU82_ORYSJ|nr:hypothetical protein OSJNBa0023H09.15 [Oryza sativa Japonica Group]
MGQGPKQSYKPIGPIQKGLTPFKDYGRITQAQWDEFVALKTSAEEKEKSQKMAELARRNEYPHHLGSTNYQQAVKKWAKQDEEMEKAGKPVPMKNHNPRSRNWVRARTPAFTPEGDVVFKDQKLHEARAAARDECNIYWSQKMKHGAAVLEPEPSYPFDDVTEDTPCKLLIPVSRVGKKILVATGRFIPGHRFHCQDIPDDYAKVEVRTVIEAYRMHELDFPTTEQIVYLGDAVDQFILWHKNDIELGSTDGTDRPPRIPVSPSRPPVVASPRDSPIASPSRPEPPVASPPGPEPPVASPPVPEPQVASPPVLEPPVASPQTEKDPMPDQPEQSQPEEPKRADVPVMVRTHKHKAKSASKKHYMVTAFRGRDKDIINAEFDNRKLKGFKQTFDDYLNYINSPDVPHEFENGKPFIYDWQLREGPWQLRRWHNWYIRASTMKGIDSFTVAVGIITPICVAHLIIHCGRMNYVEAEAMKKPVAYLNPCRISKPNHTYTLDEKKLPEHIKAMTPEERKAYIAPKHLEKYNEVIVLDSLDKDSNTYQEFLRIIDLAFKRYYQRGGQCKNSRERISVRNKWPLPKFPKSERELNDTSIQNIQADMCYFIHRECAHQLGQFFDNEGVLALPENKSLFNWTRRII